MTENGYGYAHAARKFEDVESLKKFISSGLGRRYDVSYYGEVTLGGYQTTTGTDAVIETTDSIAIAQIGKTELTLVGACSANSDDYDGMIVTLVYLSNDGVSHTATCTINTTNSTTETAFLDSDGDAVTDAYCPVSMSSNTALNAANTFGCGSTGALTWATIAAETTDATEATMYGVGCPYIRSHTNHDDADGAVVTIDYFTPWGERVLAATGTIPAADGTVETRFFKSDTTTTVKDFHRLIHVVSDTAPTANSHEFLITDASCANVDGSGGDVYGVVIEASVQSCNLYYHCPENFDAWVGRIKVLPSQNAAADSYTLKMHINIDGESAEKVIPYTFGSYLDVEPCIHIEEETDVYFEIVDNATAAVLGFEVTYIYAKKQ